MGISRSSTKFKEGYSGIPGARKPADPGQYAVGQTGLHDRLLLHLSDAARWIVWLYRVTDIVKRELCVDAYKCYSVYPDSESGRRRRTLQAERLRVKWWRTEGGITSLVYLTTCQLVLS